METDAAVGITAFGAVFEIAFHRASDGSQLAAYLMMPTGLQIDFQQRIVFAPHQGLVGQNSQFSLFGIGFGNKRLVELLIAHQPVFQSSFGLFRCALNNGPVGFSKIVLRTERLLLEHIVEAGEGFGCAGKEHHSARGSVQPMRHAQEHFAGLVVFDLDIGLYHLAQRRITRFVTLHDLVAGFVDSDDMIIFVENGHFNSQCTIHNAQFLWRTAS